MNLEHAGVRFFPQLWGPQHFWNIHMAKCLVLGSHEYDEIEKDVVRAGNTVVTGFLSDKVTEEEWNSFYLGVSLHLQKKGCISEQAEVNILYKQSCGIGIETVLVLHHKLNANIWVSSSWAVSDNRNVKTKSLWIWPKRMLICLLIRFTKVSFSQFWAVKIS